MCGSVLGSALPAPSHYSWKVHHPDQTELWNQSVIMQLFGHSTFQFCTLGCIHEVSNLFGTFNLNVLSCHTNVIYFWKVQLHYVLFMKWKCLDNLNPMLDISTYLHIYLLLGLSSDEPLRDWAGCCLLMCLESDSRWSSLLWSPLGIHI